MIGRISPIAIFLVLALGLAAASSAAAPAKDDLVLPKSAWLRVEASVGAKSAPQWADQVDIGWPAKVLSVNGQWLAISDDGGYTLPGHARAKRWVLKDEVVRIIDNDTPSSYTGQIEAPSANKRQLARLHWLRGICRQTKTPERFPAPQMAIADFREANDLDHTLADAWMRRAQLLAEIDPLKCQASWESFFKNAYAQFFYANSRKGTKPATAHARGIAPKSCGPSLSDCPTDPLRPPADTDASLIAWSKYAPPQLYFEVGRAYQHLSDAYWRTAEAKNVAKAKKAADDAARKAKHTKRAADDLAGEVKQLRTEASRIRKEAEQVSRNAEERVVQNSERAAARAQTIAAEAEADAASARALAAGAKAKAATADADFVKAEAEADKAKGKYKEYFIQALRYFQWASHSNPTWFRPSSAQGDLFRTCVETSLAGNLKNGLPKKGVKLPARDAFSALEHYDESIRLNDRFDEAHRGRSKALWFLGMVDEFTDADVLCRTLPLGSRFRGLLCGDPDARSSVLDAAYESAKTASLLTNDRDAKNLQARAKAEMALAFHIQANVGLNYVAQVSETLKQAMAYSDTIDQRAELNASNFQAGVQSSFGMAFFDAQNDVELGQVSRRAEAMRKGARSLLKKLPLIDKDYYPLAKTIVSANLAIDEIADRKNSGSAERGARNHEVVHDDVWPVQFSTLGDLLEHNSRIDFWNWILDRLDADVAKQRDCDLRALENNERVSPIFAELEKCHRDWQRAAQDK